VLNLRELTHAEIYTGFTLAWVNSSWEWMRFALAWVNSRKGILVISLENEQNHLGKEQYSSTFAQGYRHIFKERAVPENISLLLSEIISYL